MVTTALRFTFLVVFLMLVACAMVAWTPEATRARTPVATPAPTPEATLGDGTSVFDPFLKAVDHEIRDNRGQGDVIYLRGVNLGGWLLFERYMTPMNATENLKDDWLVRDKLAHCFGPEMRDSLIASYEDAWITEADLDNIAALGFNVIRLPFWYRNLQEEEDRTWPKGDFKIDWRKGGGEKIDWLVANAWKHHIYVILDFHGLPGGQSVKDNTGREGINELWNNNNKNENVRHSIEIWQEIARHFKNNPAVAAYDLINEPWGAPSRKALWDMYDCLYKAVRAIDPDHIITLEACWRGKVQGKDINWNLDVLPDPTDTDPETPRWTNVVYQLHAYEFPPDPVPPGWDDLQKQKDESNSIIDDIVNHQDWHVPCLVGEFNCLGQPKAWEYTICHYQDNHVNWTMWTYKATHGTGNDSWGVYNPKPPLLAKTGNKSDNIPDVQQDPADVIRSKWSKWTTEAAFERNPDHLREMAMPVPVDHQYTCLRGTKLVENSPGVLANVKDKDLNPDKGKLTALPVSNPAHGSLILTAHGSLILNPDGSFTYTPTNTFIGVDHFRYRVFDDKYESVLIGTVTINVE